jgi:hypothetical protein
MRSAALVLGLVASTAPSAFAEPLPSGAMGIVVGAVAGTGPDASRLGVGYIDAFSFQAAWQPMDSERRIGWAARWTTLFTASYGGSAAQVADLQAMQMDFSVGVRIRPSANPKRYLTFRGGPALFRANQTIPPKMRRAFIGPVASVGFQQYLVGTRALLDIDVRYGLIGEGPTQIALTAALSITGP